MTRQKLNCLLLLALGLLLFPTSGRAEQGNAMRGEALFVGAVSFSQGGAPCLACHGIAGHSLGLAAGASYGPDLSAIYADYGEEGVRDVLDQLSFESMVAIYDSRPLTDAEKSDLVAFFGSVSTEMASGTVPQMFLHVVIVTAFFVVFLGLIGWRRLQGVRRPLVERARHGKGESV